MLKKSSLLGLVLLVALVGGSFATQPATAQDTVEISFVHIFGNPDDVRGAVVQGLIDAFMAENPNVVVTAQSTTDNYGELFDAALLAAEQGNAPTVVQVDESLTQLAVDSGYFIPIEELATEEQMASLDDLLPQVLDFYSVSGKLWGIPWNTSNPLLYYNVDMFKAAGLDPAAPPTTFDEMIAACETLMSAEIETLQFCANWPLVSWFPEQWLAMQNALLLDNNNGRDARANEIFLTSPEMINIVTWWKTMKDAGYYTYSGRAQDYTGEAIIFLGKSTAMHINSTAGLSNFLLYSEAQGFELGVAPLIKPNADANNGVTVGGASLFITAGHSDEEARTAADFIFFITNTENGAVFHKGTGYLPNRQSTIDLLNAEGWFEENPFYRIALDQLLNSQNNPATAGIVLGPASQARGTIEEAIQSVIDGGSSPEEALAVAKERIDADLRDYNSLFE